MNRSGELSVGSALAAEPLAQQQARLPYRGIAAATAAAGLLVTALLVISAYDRTAADIGVNLAHSADNFSNAIERAITDKVQAVALVANAVVEAHPMSRGEFESIAMRNDLDRYALHALTWVPRVIKSSIRGYESFAAAQGIDGFKIDQGRTSGGRIPDAEREYYPVLYVEPADYARSLRGVNLARFARLSSAMWQAMAARQAQVVSSAGSEVLTDGRVDLLVIAPVFEKPEDRAEQSALLGFVVGFFDVADVFSDAERYSVVGINYALFDDSQPNQHLRISTGTPFDKLDTTDAVLGAGAQPVLRVLETAGLNWSMEVRLEPERLSDRYVGAVSPVLLGGSLLTAFVVTLLIAGGRHATRIHEFTESLQSNHRQLEAEARERARREDQMRVMQLAIDQSPNGIMIALPDGRIEYVNKMFERVTGYSSEQAIGNTPRILQSGFTAKQVYADLWQSVLACRVWRGELLNRRRDGQLFWSNASIWPILDDHGDLMRLVSVFQDTTERLQQRDRLKQLSHAISQFSAIVIIADAKSRVLYANRQYAEFIGSVLDEILILEHETQQSGGKIDDSVLRQLQLSISNDESWKGEVLHRNEAGDPYWASLAISRILDESGVEAQFMAVSEDVTERIEAEAQIKHFALHDTLTGLANRLQFNDRLNQGCRQVVRQQSRLALMVVDLDDFKGVNDSLGHDVGDRLLREVADRLMNSVRGSDTVARKDDSMQTLLARIGGDEFYVLLFDAQNLDGVASTAERLLNSLSEPVEIDYQRITTGASIGIAVCPDDTRDATQLTKFADIALYQAKANGRGRYCFFEPRMERDIKQRKALERDLRQAIGDELGLSLHFQPQVRARDGRLAGCEALLRWQHPERGPISPAEFIPIAEASGLIVELGAWVIDQACLQIARWRDAGCEPVPVAVNLSAVQFHHGDIAELIERAIAAHSIERRLLWVEITETVVMQDTDATLNALRQLHDADIHIALDDFGTGYSSLGYLTRFPIDKIKLDRSFINKIIDDPATSAVVRSIVDLSHRLGKRVTAEGAEAIEQVRELQAYQVDEIQGFYFSRPLPADQFMALLSTPEPFAALLPTANQALV